MDNSKQVRAALSAIVMIAEAIRASAEVPAGHIYATVMGHMDLATFGSFIDKLVGAKVVERRGDLLLWVGSHMSNKKGGETNEAQ